MEYDKKVMIKDIADFFGFEQITGDNQALNRWVVVPDVNRPGLELAGFYEHTEPRRIVVIGDKEQAFIATLDSDVQRDRFQMITDAYTPMIVLSRDRECPPVLKEVAQEANFPIFRSNLPTYRVMVDIITFLDEHLAPCDTLHGELLDVYGKGILITGESGLGKSEIVLELIKKGHVLIADDRVDVCRVHNSIVGHSPELLYGMLEIRGIGIIDVAKMFGASALMSKGNIDLVIHLEKFDQNREYCRVGNEEDIYTDILGMDIPTIVLPVKEGRSMSTLVESAVTNFRLKESGFNSAKEFERRVYENIARQNEIREEAK